MLEQAPRVAEDMGAKFGQPGLYQEIAGSVTDYCRRMQVNLNTDPAPEDERGTTAISKDKLGGEDCSSSPHPLA